MNPYQSPSINVSTEPASRSEGSLRGRKHVRTRFVLATLTSACLGFVCWCVLDFVTVRVLPYPGHARDFDWLVVAYPILAFVLAAVALKSESYAPRFRLSLGSTVLACLLALLLIVILGLPFHFSIGGSK